MRTNDKEKQKYSIEKKIFIFKKKKQENKKKVYSMEILPNVLELFQEVLRSDHTILSIFVGHEFLSLYHAGSIPNVFMQHISDGSKP